MNTRRQLPQLVVMPALLGAFVIILSTAPPAQAQKLAETRSIARSSNSEGQDEDRRPEVIRLVERIQAFTVEDVASPGPTLGDRLIFTSDLFDTSGRKVGRDAADCVTVRINPNAPPSEQQIVQCTITVELPDGQITFQGLAQGTENFFAVTGGTGAYRTARGEAFARDRAPLQVADITITIFR